MGFLGYLRGDYRLKCPAFNSPDGILADWAEMVGLHEVPFNSPDGIQAGAENRKAPRYKAFNSPDGILEYAPVYPRARDVLSIPLMGFRTWGIQARFALATFNSPDGIPITSSAPYAVKSSLTLSIPLMGFWAARGA